MPLKDKLYANGEAYAVWWDKGAQFQTKICIRRNGFVGELLLRSSGIGLD